MPNWKRLQDGLMLADAPATRMLARWQTVLTPGQFRAAKALLGGAVCRTYADAAARLGVSANTLKTQLRRIRQQHPDVWAEIAWLRAHQRAARHAAAVTRAEAHSRRWHRKQFHRRYGYWPRERRR